MYLVFEIIPFAFTTSYSSGAAVVVVAVNVVLLVAAVIFESGLAVEYNRLMEGDLVVVDVDLTSASVVDVGVVVFAAFLLHNTFCV